MTIKAKDIKGFLVEKNEINGVTCDLKFDDYYYAKGFNKAIDLMAERSIGMNRDIIAKILAWGQNDERMFDYWDGLIQETKDYFIMQADAIIANEHEIIQAVQ